MTRARLIVNPSSGRDRAPALLPRVNERLRTVVDDLDITITTSAADVERAAARATGDGSEALFVAGGDGTLNALLRGLDGAPYEPARLPIGVIPMGTGNDFTKALGLGEDADVALDALLEGRTIDVDLGTLDERPFANTSAGGFVADVSDAVSEELKDVAGKAAYLIGGARVLLGAEPFTARLRLGDGGGRFDPWRGPIDLQMFAVCNGRFIGGGNPIAPDALVDDGLLDVVVVPRMSLLEFVRVLQQIGAGEHCDADGVLHFRAPALDLEFSRTVRVNTDGEVLEADGCRYRTRARAARFFCGAAPAAGRLASPAG